MIDTTVAVCKQHQPRLLPQRATSSQHQSAPARTDAAAPPAERGASQPRRWRHAQVVVHLAGAWLPATFQLVGGGAVWLDVRKLDCGRRAQEAAVRATLQGRPSVCPAATLKLPPNRIKTEILASNKTPPTNKHQSLAYNGTNHQQACI